MKDFIRTLINASEKAACVARSCCTGSTNEDLLVAEKFEGDANARFSRDFKTIADVLAQEAAKTEISSRYPELADHVRGEECNEIGGVKIALRDNVCDTAELLRYLVAPPVAKRMAEAAHGDSVHAFCDNVPETLPNIDTSDLGIWIDPIDATAEFIAGFRGEADADRGLSCVTVLIGAYNKTTGEPVAGAINQPFYNNGKGRVFWGIKHGSTQEWGGTDIPEPSTNNIVLMSGAEKPEIMKKFQNLGWEVKSVPGAGHKLLKVVLGEAAAYIVSQGTTFRWDTCGPHAILLARGGDLVNYATHIPLTYNIEQDSETQKYCNSEGIMAYSDATVLEKIKNDLNSV